jgi:hypothetical protein
MGKCSFTAVIEIRGVNPYVLVTKSHATRLKPGWRKPLPALVRINGKPREPHRINLMPVGDGHFYLYLNGVIRKAANAATGDSVLVWLDVDASYRNGPQHATPGWFREALKKNAQANKNWRALPPSRRKEVLRYFARLKSEQARARNLSRAMEALSRPKAHFMGRDWNQGR